MSNEPTASSRPTAGDAVRRTRLLNALPWLWLGLSAAWAVVVFATDQLAWPLALWIATTVGPLTALKTRHDWVVVRLNRPARSSSSWMQQQVDWELGR